MSERRGFSNLRALVIGVLLLFSTLGGGYAYGFYAGKVLTTTLNTWDGSWLTTPYVNATTGLYSEGSLYLGSAADVRLYRSGANTLSLGAGDSLAATTFGGDISLGGNDLVGGGWLNGTSAGLTNAYLASLTNGRVVLVGADGRLIDDADLTFSGQKLTATDFSFTNDLFWGAANRTDTIAYPEQASGYVIWKEGTTYYTKNTNTGAVSSGTSFVQTALQNALTASGATGGGTVYLKVAGTLAVNTLIIPSYVTLEGLNQYATILIPNSGLSPIVKFDGATCSGLRNIHISGAGYHNTIGILIKDSHFITLENVYIDTFDQANGIGLLMNATSVSTTWCQIINPIIIGCGIGVKLMGKPAHGINANTFLGGYINGNSVTGFLSNRYTDTNSIINTDFDTNAISISIDGYDHKIFGVRFEGNTNDVTLGVNSYDNVFFGGSTTALVSDSGLRNRFRDVIGYVTENSGTFSIALHSKTATVTHGLSYTPTASDIGITWTTVGGLLNCTSWSVTGITSTQFVVNLYDANGAAKGPSGTVTGSWKSIKTP